MNENSTQRDAVMAALSVAEQITASSPVIPYDISIHARSVDIHMHRAPESVTGFAAAFGLEVSLREQLTGNRQPIIEARGQMAEVSVRAWSLGDKEDWDQYRAAVAGALLSLPVAWSAAAVPA